VKRRFAGKELTIAELGGVRERTLAFLEETPDRDLRAAAISRALSFYDWFAFIAAHQTRHSKQMWEIEQNLPKDVASSRK
jgi:hypothetical protein